MSSNYPSDNSRGGGGYKRGQGRGGYRGGPGGDGSGHYTSRGGGQGGVGGRGGYKQQANIQQQQQTSSSSSQENVNQGANINVGLGIDPALISASSGQQNQKYVKKGAGSQQQTQKQQQQQQMSQQDLIEEMNRMAEQQMQGSGGGLTAEQKFQMMLSGQLFDQQEETKTVEKRKYSDPYEEPIDDAIIIPQTQSKIQVQTTTAKPQQQQYKQPRKRVGKDLLLTKYKRLDEVNLNQFEKDVLNWIEIFSTNAQDPEINEPLEAPAEGVTLQSQPKRAPPSRGGYNQRGAPGQWRGPNDRRPPTGAALQALEEDENEEDPEWVDFDPKKDTGTFFGRTIANEDELRENIKKEKERQKKIFGERKTLQQMQEDEFEKLVQEEKENARKQAALLDQEIEKQVEEVALDIEKSERNYSDIDLIYEKNAKQNQQKRVKQTLDDDQLDDLFNTLMHEEEKKIQQKQQVQQKPQPVAQVQQQQQPVQQQAQQQQQQSQTQTTQLPQQLQEQIKNLTIQQKQKLQTQKIVSQARPKFTALQNVQNLFQNLPVVTHEKHRIKMQEIADIEETQEQSGQIFKQLMASINPFSKFIIDENSQQGQNPSAKNWQLEETIFQKPVEQVKPENLKKTSSEMFCIYKYFSDPLMKIKSTNYTEDKFVQIKDLFPTQNLLETSPLNLQLQNITPQMLNMMNMQQQNMAVNLKNSSEFVPQRKTSINVEGQAQADTNATGDQKQLTKAPTGYTGTQDQLESLEEGDDQENEESTQPPVRDLGSMESQLKSLLGFNPK